LNTVFLSVSWSLDGSMLSRFAMTASALAFLVVVISLLIVVSLGLKLLPVPWIAIRRPTRLE
jgi:uncharacterized membrane protein YjgN (DUF898 family)